MILKHIWKFIPPHYPEFAIYSCQMLFYSTDCHNKPFGYLPIAVAVGGEGSHSPLRPAQIFIWIRIKRVNFGIHIAGRFVSLRRKRFTEYVSAALPSELGRPAYYLSRLANITITVI